MKNSDIYVVTLLIQKISTSWNNWR